MTRHAPLGGLILLAIGLQTGCGQQIGGMLYFFTPRQIQEAAYEFMPGDRIALLIENANPREESPVFSRALHDKLEAYFRERESEATFVPRQDLQRLRRRDGYQDYSIQKIGQAVGADYVIYFRLDSLQDRETPGYPVLAPSVEGRMKLIGVHRPPDDARVWPDDPDGHPVECRRQAREAVSPDVIDTEMAKLGRDTAYFVMMPFFDVDLEVDPPVEP